MAEYREANSDTTYVEKRSNTGLVIGGVVLAVLIVVGLLFATGFWSANVKGGALPTVNVSAKEWRPPGRGGALQRSRRRNQQTNRDGPQGRNEKDIDRRSNDRRQRR